MVRGCGSSWCSLLGTRSNNICLTLGACAIAASSGLRASDVCLNFMPLFHVGGICRNLLAPLFAGGSTTAMPFFDVGDFWTVAVEKKCTWYYGAPTMHLLVVNSAQAMATGAPRTAIRFVANAAGPLLPSVAIQLRNVFPGAAVLTSYGMTECMPITCPPPGYALERAGSSGQAICPDVAIVDDAGERVSFFRRPCNRSVSSGMAAAAAAAFWMSCVYFCSAPIRCAALRRRDEELCFCSTFLAALRVGI